jgi:endonuclease/exonuclease/phosphatase family metal-dependent hydrolase
MHYRYIFLCDGTFRQPLLLLMSRLRIAFLIVSGSLLAIPASLAQTVPGVGSPDRLDVATWNIEWFGDPMNGPSNVELQFNNVLAVMRQAEIDLWSLQEIASPFQFNRLLDSLGTGWAGQRGDLGGTQRTAFIWRTSRINRISMDHILTNLSYEFASRPPQQMRATVVMPDTTLEVRFIALHAKCCGGAEDYNRRLAGANALKNYIDNLLFINAHVMVLGDFNDRLRVSISGGQASPYQNFYNDTQRYEFATRQIDLANLPTYCSNTSCTSGTTLDHILMTHNLRDDWVPNSASRYTQLLTALPGYVNTTSDHLPVYTSFSFASTVASEPGVLPQTFALAPPYPNPFQHSTVLSYDLPAATDVRLEVFDGLGRSVTVLHEGFRPAGRHEARFDAGGLTPGLYVVRLTAGQHSATRRLMHVP